jgi:uncharacterized membrane protein YoaK (UPF0700 family)
MPEDSPAHAGAQHEVPITVAMAVLTVTAGAVDAISFLGLGQVFTALATGNLLFLAFALGGQGSVPVERPAIALAAFVLGVIMGSALFSALGRRRWFPMALGVEAALVAVAGFVALGVAGLGATDVPDPVVIVVVAVAMGVRSMAALRAAIPGMPTQMIQGSLVAVIDTFVSRWSAAGRSRGGAAGSASRPALAKLSMARHAATIGGTLLGGVLGALLVNAGAGLALLAVAVAVFVTAGVYAFVPRYRPPTTPPAASIPP